MQVSGKYPDNRPFITAMFTYAGGVGARATKSGLSACSYPTGIAAVPVEVVEASAPIHFVQKSLRMGSGGNGQQIGGLGQTIEFTVDTEQTWELNAVTSRLVDAPLGIFGGEPGAAGSFTVNGEPVRTQARITLQPGDMVRLDLPGGGGYDVGHISLTGDLVRLQLKKKSVKDGSLFLNIIRRANDRDIEKLNELRSIERETMVRARAISRTLDLDMKLGDVEYQGDGRKCTFFYTADGRVDFRELIRHFAKEFKVKIEMRQIGARQESSRIGGIGTCGRELCCSTWLSDFKSVSTVAARYQQLAINQAKLSGMCGRLKCCLNYELDTYLDALEDFPQNPERLKTQNGSAILIKTWLVITGMKKQ